MRAVRGSPFDSWPAWPGCTVAEMWLCRADKVKVLASLVGRACSLTLPTAPGVATLAAAIFIDRCRSITVFIRPQLVKRMYAYNKLVPHWFDLALAKVAPHPTCTVE
jgi:hypothetical protein